MILLRCDVSGRILHCWDPARKMKLMAGSHKLVVWFRCTSTVEIKGQGPGTAVDWMRRVSVLWHSSWSQICAPFSFVALCQLGERPFLSSLFYPILLRHNDTITKKFFLVAPSTLGWPVVSLISLITDPHLSISGHFPEARNLPN